MQEPKSYSELVTPETANEWLNDYPFINQRPLRREYVLYLANEMFHGRFKEYTDIEFGICESGERYLVDGQHRLQAIIKSQIPSMFFVKELYYPTFLEVKKAYIETDRGPGRSIRDGMRALGTEDMGLTDYEASKLAGALNVIYNGFHYGGWRRTSVGLLHNKLYEWVEYYQEYLRVIDSRVNIAFKRRLLAREILAVGLVTLRFSEGKLIGDLTPGNFWSGLASGEMLTRSSPMILFRELLLKNEITTTRKGGKSKQKLTYLDKAVYIRVAWNSYTQHREIDRLVYPSKLGMRVPLKYTPFDFSEPVSQYRNYFEDSHWPGWEQN